MSSTQCSSLSNIMLWSSATIQATAEVICFGRLRFGQPSGSAVHKFSCGKCQFNANIMCMWSKGNYQKSCWKIWRMWGGADEFVETSPPPPKNSDSLWTGRFKAERTLISMADLGFEEGGFLLKLACSLLPLHFINIYMQWKRLDFCCKHQYIKRNLLKL